METRLNSNTSKLGHSLIQISERAGPTKDEVKETLGQATGLTPKDVGIIFNMKQRRLSLEQITQDPGSELEILKALADRSTPRTTEEIQEPHTAQPTMTLLKHQESTTPTFFSCCLNNKNQLLRVNLLTGEQSCHEVPNYKFRGVCRMSELPGGRLLITGGFPAGREVEKIDTLREYSVLSVPPMHTPRLDHAAVYHSQYLYVLGGFNGRGLRECERYVCAENRWEELPALPVGAYGMSAVELENTLYALGGANHTGNLNVVQTLRIDSLTWELMQLSLPQADKCFPCFKTDTQAYLVINKTLYSFTPLEVKPIKTVPRSIKCRSSYYSRGTLYYAFYDGLQSLVVGELAYPY
jgi:hypothetical protein